MGPSGSYRSHGDLGLFGPMAQAYGPAFHAYKCSFRPQSTTRASFRATFRLGLGHFLLHIIISNITRYKNMGSQIQSTNSWQQSKGMLKHRAS